MCILFTFLENNPLYMKQCLSLRWLWKAFNLNVSHGSVRCYVFILTFVFITGRNRQAATSGCRLPLNLTEEEEEGGNITELHSNLTFCLSSDILLFLFSCGGTSGLSWSVPSFLFCWCSARTACCFWRRSAAFQLKPVHWQDACLR